MAAKKASPRAARRAVAREVEKLLERRDKLAELSPGGAPERAVPVESASLVEPMARSTPCARCGGAVRVDEHVVRVVAGRSLRVAVVSCVACGSRRELFYVIAPRVLH
jgi:hypothetical protein